MKHLFTLLAVATVWVALASNSIACGGACPSEGKKDKDKTEEGTTQS